MEQRHEGSGGMGIIATTIDEWERIQVVTVTETARCGAICRALGEWGLGGWS